jgi:hypothetical protein
VDDCAASDGHRDTVPFTLAHPAAVLPLARRPLVPAALVAGSLSPDVPYFLPVPRSAGSWYEPFVNATTTHSWPGALTVAVPTAAVLLALWWVVRAPLRVVVGAPQDGPIRHRLPDVARTLPWVLASLALGVLTHVGWDAFTHGDGVVVQHVAWLREPVVGQAPVARVVQHVSTAVGLLVLAGWAWRRIITWRAAGGRPAVDRRRAVTITALVVAACAGAVVGLVGSAGAGLEATLSAAAKGGGAALAAAVLTGAAVWWPWQLARTARRQRS